MHLHKAMKLCLGAETASIGTFTAKMAARYKGMKRAASFLNQRGSGMRLTQGVLVDSAFRSTASVHG